MAGRLVAPDLFTVMGTVLDWATVAELSAQLSPADEIAKGRGLSSPTGVHLRWAFTPELGYPQTPFTVWVRRRNPTRGTTALKPGSAVLGGNHVLILDQPCVEVTVLLQSGPGGTSAAWTGMPLGSRMVDTRPVTAGPTSLTLRGPLIRTVTLPVGATVLAATGELTNTADDPAWKELEIVGLPGDGRAATGTDLQAPQGMVNALGDPVDAALERYRRGAPFYGWDLELEAGVAAPGWVLADPKPIIGLFHDEMLTDFADMIDDVSSTQQHLQTYQRTVSAPSGQLVTATFNPLRMLLYSALTDPLNSLVTGFGTAYDGQALSDHLPGTDSILSSVSTAAAAAPVLDFMVTSLWLDAAGDKVEYAALLLGTQNMSLPPTAPTGVTATSRGADAPVGLDDPFHAVVELAWTVPGAMMPFHLGSHALSRRALTPSGSAVTLLRPRPKDVAVQPIGDTFVAETPSRRAGSDTSYPIDRSVDPNVLGYFVANCDIFGRWSRWAGASCTATEPPPGKVTLAGARLDITVAAGPCLGTLTVELSWNWASRGAATFEVVGRRYPQVRADDPPPDPSVPAATTDLAASGSGLLARVQFTVATNEDPGLISATGTGAGMTAGTQYLSPDGMSIQATPLPNRGPRRYRLTVSGFDLDFDASGRWGLALWARGVERPAPGAALPPGRSGPWTTTPIVVSAADPRPPVSTSVYDAVLLASLRDADGRHHARLSWSPMVGATGYRVYTASESTFRAMRNLAEPNPADTLATRLTQLRAAFQSVPDRRPFTRDSAAAVTSTSTPVVLPRGTKDLHLFVVLGVSAGEVESAWPTTADPQCGGRMMAFAAPQTIAPAPPQLEVSRIGPDPVPPHPFRAQLRIRTNPGAQVSRIDLHRVRVPAAATAIDTMGPPIAQISGTAAGFTVTATPPGDPASPSSGGTEQTIDTITGTDTVDGSWRPVFYRAVAWGTDDIDRGQYGVRSLPSVPRQVVIPPATDPALNALTSAFPVAGSAQVRIDTATVAPVAPTPLGPHRVEAEAVARDTAGVTTTVPLTPAGDTLDQLPTAPPGTGVSGLWRDEPAVDGSTALHLLVRRSAFDTELRVRMRITDPIGRLTEQTFTVPAGTPVVPPDIENPTLKARPAGVLLTFTTSVPNSVTGLGDYVLEAALRSTDQPTGTARARTALADIPLLRGDDPWDSNAEPLPIRRTRRSQGTTRIYVGCRAPGELRVTITAPDGTAATLTRVIGRGPIR